MSISAITANAPRASASISATQRPAEARAPSNGQDTPPADAIIKQPQPAVIINGQGQGLSFSVDALTGTRIISVVDLRSGEVLRQIPSEEVVNFLRHLEEQKGALISIKS